MKEMLHIPKEVILGSQLVELSHIQGADNSDSESDWDEGPSIRINIRGRGRTQPLDTVQTVVPMGHTQAMMAWTEDSTSIMPAYPLPGEDSIRAPSSGQLEHNNLLIHAHNCQQNTRHSTFIDSQTTTPDSSPSESPSRTLRNHTLTLGVRRSPTQGSEGCVELAPLTSHTALIDMDSDISIDMSYDDYGMDDSDNDDENTSYNNDGENHPSIIVHEFLNEHSSSSGVVTMATTDTEDSIHDNLDNSIDIEPPSSPDEGFQEVCLESIASDSIFTEQISDIETHPKTITQDISTTIRPSSETEIVESSNSCVIDRDSGIIVNLGDASVENQNEHKLTNGEISDDILISKSQKSVAQAQCTPNTLAIAYCDCQSACSNASPHAHTQDNQMKDKHYLNMTGERDNCNLNIQENINKKAKSDAVGSMDRFDAQNNNTANHQNTRGFHS